jgi:hypothetical protein
MKHIFWSFQLDWDMMIGTAASEDLPVDLVIRKQPEVQSPEVAEPETGPPGPSARRRIVHRVANLDGFDPGCGQCCGIQ